MNKNFKRVIAYMIDTILVSIIAFLITNVGPINYQLDNYNKNYKEYEKIVTKYEDLEEKLDEAKEKYEDKEIKKEEYKKVKKEFNDYKDNYMDNVKKYGYKLSKNSIVSSIILISLVIAYFGMFQYFANGQTLGKKIMKLRVVANKEKALNMFNYIVRCVILNGVFSNVALLICVYLCNYNSYYTANYIITNIASIIEIIILMMVFMNKDGRGLHDYLAGTKVIEIDTKGEEVEYIPPVKKD